VGRSAFLAASGLSGIVCEQCHAKLVATLASRARLNGGAVVLSILAGNLAQTLGAPIWLALAIGASALAAWYAVGTESLLVLEPSEPSVPTIT
jgi:hypothetical protein